MCSTVQNAGIDLLPEHIFNYAYSSLPLICLSVSLTRTESKAVTGQARAVGYNSGLAAGPLDRSILKPLRAVPDPSATPVSC